jgi:hypothetical protein
MVNVLPASETTTQYIFANPSDETDDTLNPMLIPAIIGVTLVAVASAYFVGKSQ